VYLPAEYHDKIKELAKERKASSTIRDAICMILDGDDSYKAGYNKAIKDVSRVIKSCKEIEIIAIRGKYLDNLLIEQIEQLTP
jgi:bisphosphoglycerate-independent phosphoglycerate mutase (AlkP superfamily)